MPIKSCSTCGETYGSKTCDKCPHNPKLINGWKPKTELKRNCLRCGWKWIQRKQHDQDPAQCPRCKSRCWNKPKD